MSQHPNARLTPRGRELLCERVGGVRVADARSRLLLAPLALAAETGVPARTCAGIVARRGGCRAWPTWAVSRARPTATAP